MGRRLQLVQKQKYSAESKAAQLHEGKAIKLKSMPTAKTTSQALYIESLQEADITIGMGPAGSGKSFLAMAVAVKKLLDKEVSRIVITRPIVEAGESLGYLPGSFEEKISPYLLPLLDALNDLVGPTMAKKLLEDGSIEFAPLAYMRGRTFSNCYVLLDESQNTSVEQMKLFITRIGNHSQFAINGDGSQSDLNKNIENGLDWVVRKLRGKMPSINVIEFTSSDVVRSSILSKMIKFLDAPDNVNYDFRQDTPKPKKKSTLLHS
jgi:phosphate starvation-inducible protein PhoH and related proteins